MPKFTLDSIEMSGTLPYKCYLVSSNGEKEIRRFTVESDVVGNFTYLKEKIQSIYPQLLQEKFTLQYIDEEGDMVTISSDDELVAALMYAKRKDGEPLRIIIQISSSPKHEGQTQNGNCQGNVHMGVTCDGCQGIIRGYRYKCFQCPEFDLCGKCESAGIHPGHTLIRVTGPIPPSFQAMRSLLARGRGAAIPPYQRYFYNSDDYNRSLNAGGNFWYPESMYINIPGTNQASGVATDAVKPQYPYKAQSNEFPSALRATGPEFPQRIGNSMVSGAFGSLGLGNLPFICFNGLTNQQKQEEKKPVEEPKKEFIIPIDVEKEQNQVVKNVEVAVASATAEAAVAHAAEQAASPLPPLSCEYDDWFVIENEKEKQASLAAAVEPQLGARLKTSQQKPEIKAPLHQDPTVAASLETMLAMGFTNEGGWLGHLLEVKGGDISEALDVLYARLQPQNR